LTVKKENGLNASSYKHFDRFFNLSPMRINTKKPSRSYERVNN